MQVPPNNQFVEKKCEPAIERNWENLPCVDPLEYSPTRGLVPYYQHGDHMRRDEVWTPPSPYDKVYKFVHIQDSVKMAGTKENPYVLRRRARIRWEATPYAQEFNPHIEIFADHMKPKIYADMRIPAEGITKCFDIWLSDKDKNIPVVYCGIKGRDREFFQNLLDPKITVSWEAMDECLWTKRRNHSKYHGTTNTKTVITDSGWFKAFNDTDPREWETLRELTKPYFLGTLPVRGCEGRLAERWYMPWMTSGKNSCWILVCIDITDKSSLCAKVYDPRKKQEYKTWNLERLLLDFPKLLEECHQPPDVKVPVYHKRIFNTDMTIASLFVVREDSCIAKRKSTQFLKVLRVLEKMLEDNYIRGELDCADDMEKVYRKWYAVEIWRTGFEFIIVDTCGKQISLPGESMESYLCDDGSVM